MRKRGVAIVYASVAQTEIWLRLSAVNGSRSQLLPRSSNVIPASPIGRDGRIGA